MDFRIIAAFFVSLIVTVLVGLWFIPLLRRIKAGQSIREDGPVWHNKKQGTPTMGGIMFIVGIGVACLVVGFQDFVPHNLLVFAFACVFGLIGFIDDYNKLKKRQNLGLNAKQKFILQLIAAFLFLWVLYELGYINSSLYIPFFNTVVEIPTIVYYVFAAFIIVGTVNAVNITDGVDGLATGVTIPVAVCLTMIAILWNFTAMGVFAAALAGGLVAFLFFNFHPAKVFMGDVGSLFLGGAICAIVFVMDMPLILLPLGFVYIVETMSDIIQVTYFKLSKGKRVFKMAPIHHHFEMIGWSEYKLFAVFTTVSAIFAVIAYFGVHNRPL
jgi:phospho-N-acetylmuramoyl-pentapeptide-transferase